MKTGDILLFRSGGGLASRLISWGTESEYIHVAVCVSWELNLAIEAISRSGVRTRSIAKISPSCDVFRLKKGHFCDVSGVTRYLTGKLNRRYDYLGVLFLGVMKLLKKLKFPGKIDINPWQKTSKLFCSELCYEAFLYGGGIDIVPHISDPAAITPKDIASSPVLEIIKHPYSPEGPLEADSFPLDLKDSLKALENEMRVKLNYIHSKVRTIGGVNYKDIFAGMVIYKIMGVLTLLLRKVNWHEVLKEIAVWFSRRF